MSELKAPAKILVADDSPLVARLLSNILRGGGYTVVTAADGLEAAQMVYNEMPDLIVLDIFMPRMNGYQVCRLLKHDTNVAHIPVIINTASEGRSAQFWSRHTGADDFMLKGIAPAEILGKVGWHLEHCSHPDLAPSNHVPGTEDILSKVSALADAELYATTIQAMELKTIQDNLCEGILVLNTHRRVSSVNQYLCRVLGIEAKSAMNQTPVECLGEAAGTVVQEMVDAILNGGKTAGKARPRHLQVLAIAKCSINRAWKRRFPSMWLRCAITSAKLSAAFACCKTSRGASKSSA